MGQLFGPIIIEHFPNIRNMFELDDFEFLFSKNLHLHDSGKS